MSPAWMAAAECAGMDADLFFVDVGYQTKDAKEACAICPVREECLEYAIANHEKYGVWGGLTHNERRKVAAERRGSRLPDHGTRGRYALGCRCCDCAQANRLYQRSLRAI